MINTLEISHEEDGCCPNLMQCSFNVKKHTSPVFRPSLDMQLFNEHGDDSHVTIGSCNMKGCPPIVVLSFHVHPRKGKPEIRGKDIFIILTEIFLK